MAHRDVLPTTAGLDTLKRALGTKVKERAAGPIIKRGTVGNLVQGTWGNSKTVIRQSAFYLDNQVHDGASGGPIVSDDGKLRGYVGKVAMIKVSILRATEPYSEDLRVPAGSTLGYGLEPLFAPPPRLS